MKKYAKGGFSTTGNFITHHEGHGEIIMPLGCQKANNYVPIKIIAKGIADEINKRKMRAKNGGIF